MFGYFFGQKGNGLSTRLNRPQSQPLPASPPTPLRMERGVICEVTPIGLLKEGEGMPDGRRESYEAVPRRPEQQGTKGPALSMSPVFSVHLLPYLNHTLSLSQPSVTPRTCSSVTLSSITSNLFTRLLVHLSTCHVTLSFSYPDPISNIPRTSLSPLLLPELVHLLPCLFHTLSPIHLTLSPYPPYPVPTLSQKK